MEGIPNSASLILDNADKIDVERFRQRTEDMVKAYLDFISKEIDGVEGAVNLEMPLVLAMGLTHINSIPMRLGINNANEKFVASVKESIISSVSEDFDICYEMAKAGKLDG